MATIRRYPRFRRDLVVRRVVESGDVAWTVHDPLRGSYFRHDPMTHELCELLDGERGADEILAAMEARYPQFSFNDEWLNELVDDLRRGGFLEETFKMNEIQRARAHEARRKWAPNSLKNVLNVQFGVIDPTRVFKFVYPVARILFTRWFVALAVLAFLGAVAQLWDKREALAVGILTMFTLTDANFFSLLTLYVILFLIVVAHEFGHGLSCMHFGGQPRRLGFMLFYFMPGMFCDVSDIYFFERRWHRAAVALAGGYVELLCFTVATFVWTGTSPDLLVHEIAFRVMLFSGATGLIFNYNPLIKLDGYYVLMSWLDMPDLRERSFKYVSDLFRGKVLRLPSEPERVTRRERRAFLIYGLTALFYSASYTWLMLLFVKNVLTTNFREAGMFVFLTFFLLSTRKYWKRLWGGARYLAIEKGGWARRHVALSVAIAVVLVVACFVPLPHHVTLETHLEPLHSRVLAAPFDGTISSVMVSAGAPVRPGTVLAVVLPNDGMSATRAGAEDAGAGDAAGADPVARARSAALGADAAWEHVRREERDGRPGGAALAELAVARARAADAASREGRGVVTAPIEGRLLEFAPFEKEGARVVAGEPIFRVGSVDSLAVIFVANERVVGDLGLGRIADLRLHAAPGRRLRCAIETVDYAPEDRPALAQSVSELVDSEKPSQRFDARARIANPDGLLRPGMSGFAKVDAPPLSLLQRVGRTYARLVRADFWL